ncbi:Lysine exporter protein (LYSE/YGGA) [Arcobacter nitrofigilis DSM 7299]|uniref:Lysine exporter protein (LYSE/YGGA) n=1 Tax=Arcobacter nitrofigilis (strain ATCC 33309 / DSM 7299 / CCUG 15893 / LMG 7604 / NCTC 12251 / CI) TaxID=572480 RepID=D5V5V1_ARCNC|nr:LysE family translocator [Arcobacter nitrofigilis]ADG93118.1 Lysine exporter protein (LYSE/YGGA) [Arcobacter nitrofigilis DSM 7299]
MSIDTFLIYSVIAFLYVLSPGPAVMLAIVNGIRTDMKTVAVSSFANILGLAVLSTASILGLGVLILTSATLFLIVKIIGAFYLIYLGIKFLRNRGILNIDEMEKNVKQKSRKSYFFESFFVAVTNPKPIIFFTAIFPQFLNLHEAIAPQFFIMTGEFLFFSFFGLCTYAFLSKKSKALLSNEKRMYWFNKFTGGLFIFLGLGLLRIKNHA